MFQDKASLRIKAMDSMMKDKPAIAMAAKKEPDEMMGEEGMIAMPVTPEEKEMILMARETNKQDESSEGQEEGEMDPMAKMKMGMK